MTGTRCTCGAGHATYGACLRAKNISVYDSEHRARDTSWYAALDRYERARREGIQPDSVTPQAVDYAVRRSDRDGRAFRADSL